MRNRREFLSGAAGIGLATARAWQTPSFTGRVAGDETTIEGIRLCWCPPGRFLMGSPSTESGHRADETQVMVTLSRGFWMAKFEVTQAQWLRVMSVVAGRAPSDQFGLGDDVPIYWVNFPGAERFCAQVTLNARRFGALPRDWECRVPTEAQWEYAARAGTGTAAAFGDTVRLTNANFTGLQRGDGRAPEAPGKAVTVGSYPANRWGLCDMHGNVFEWCRDWYHPQLPGGTDPDLSTRQGAPNRDGSYSRVRRGGAWNDPAVFCRSGFRLRYEPERASDHIGFRVAVVPM